MFAETAGVSEQLEGLLEAHCMLCGSIRGLDVGDEGAHLPLGLTGGWREQTLIALVQRTRANRLCHWQNGDLEGSANEINKKKHVCWSNTPATQKVSGLFDFQKHLSIFGALQTSKYALFLIKQEKWGKLYSLSLTLSCSSMALRMTSAESRAIWSWVSVTDAPWSTITTMCLDWGRTEDTYTGLQEYMYKYSNSCQDQTLDCTVIYDPQPKRIWTHTVRASVQ